MERQAAAKVQKTPAHVNHSQTQSARSSSAAHPLLELQRTIGNQAVQRLISSPYIQTKLKVSTPGDPFEQEADRVADTVMRMAEPEPTAGESTRIQAKPLATRITPLVRRAPEEPSEENEEEIIATKPILQRAVRLAVREDDEEEKIATKLDTSPGPQEEEEDKTVATKLVTDAPLQRQSSGDEEREEETLQTAPPIQRQTEEEEEEKIQTKSLTNQSPHSLRIHPVPGPARAAIQRLCTECEEEKPQDAGQTVELVHRKSTPEQLHDDDDVREQQVHPKGGQTPAPKVMTSVAASIHAMNGGGSPLSGTTRAFFEPRFGADLSQVRVHTDSRAAATANSIQARAFTVGPNIAFGAGQYAPESREGRQLLAHELTHVVQQNGSQVQRAQPRATGQAPQVATSVEPEVETKGGSEGPDTGFSTSVVQSVKLANRRLGQGEGISQRIEGRGNSRKGRLNFLSTHVVQQSTNQQQRGVFNNVIRRQVVPLSEAERIESRRQTGKGNDNFFVLTRASAPTFFRSAQGAITQPTIQRAPLCPGKRDSGEVTKSQSPAGVLAVDTRFDAAKESLSVQDFGIDQHSVPPTMTQSDDWRRIISMILGDPTTQVAVLGYSDCIGTEQNNQGLRDRRADAVIKAMPAEAQAKVSPILKGWWGKLTYLFPNDTAENRARNRMVLVALLRAPIDSCDRLPKATNIDQYIFLVSCLEKRLGLTNAADAPKTLSLLRQLYFGNAAWSTPRNRSKIWDDIITSRPWAPGNDPTPKLGAKLLSALQDSKEVKFDSSASSTSIEISHLLTGLDAMMNPQNPAFQANVPVLGSIYLQTNVLNHALATWAGDVASAATNYTICVDFLKFSASYDDFFKDLAADADLEGDIDAYAVWAALNYPTPNTPALQLNLPISEVLMQYYRLKNTLGGQARAQRFEVFANFYGAKVQGRKMQDRLAFQQNVYPSVSEIALLSFAKQIREVLQGNAASLGNCAGGKPPAQTGQPAPPVDLGTLLANLAIASLEMTERFTVWLERRL